VVSSDRAIRAAAREAPGQVISRYLPIETKGALEETDSGISERAPLHSARRVKEWLDLFKKGRILNK
jgi:hypothetical protein